MGLSAELDEIVGLGETGLGHEGRIPVFIVLQPFPIITVPVVGIGHASARETPEVEPRLLGFRDAVRVQKPVRPAPNAGIHAELVGSYGLKDFLGVDGNLHWGADENVPVFTGRVKGRGLLGIGNGSGAVCRGIKFKGFIAGISPGSRNGRERQGEKKFFRSPPPAPLEVFPGTRPCRYVIRRTI